MLQVLGDREISISREITKKFETIYRGKISDIIEIVLEKGEFVIIVEGFSGKIINNTSLSIREAVDFYISEGLDVMNSIKRVAKDRNMVKNDVYMEYHKGDHKCD